jgi:hypothetical protein
MSGKPSPDRFMIRRAATDGFNGLGRESKGPAMFNGHPAVVLTEAQAAKIKSQPVKTLVRVGGELTKNALDPRRKQRLRQLATSGVFEPSRLQRKTASIRTQARKIGCQFPTI